MTLDRAAARKRAEKILAEPRWFEYAEEHDLAADLLSALDELELFRGHMDALRKSYKIAVENYQAATRDSEKQMKFEQKLKADAKAKRICLLQLAHELADDLEAELAPRYDRSYPSQEAKYQRDMEPINKLRAAYPSKPKEQP